MNILPGLLTELVPFGIGTILIVISPVIRKHSEKLSAYSKIVGIIISIISLIAVAVSLFEFMSWLV